MMTEKGREVLAKTLMPLFDQLTKRASTGRLKAAVELLQTYRPDCPHVIKAAAEMAKYGRADFDRLKVRDALREAGRAAVGVG